MDAAALLPQPTTQPTPGHAPAPQENAPAEATVNTDVLMVRQGPGTDYPALDVAVRGQTLRILDRTATGDWLLVCCSATRGRTGWVSSDLLLLRPVSVTPPE